MIYIKAKPNYDLIDVKKRIYISYIDNSNYFSFFEFYKFEENEAFNKYYEKYNYNLYAFIKYENIQFNIEDLKIIDKYTLLGSLFSNGNKLYFEIDYTDIIIKILMAKNILFLNLNKTVNCITIDFQNSSKDFLKLDFISQGQNNSMYYNPYKFIDIFHLKILKSEILYLGKTKNMNKRLRNHERLAEITFKEIIENNSKFNIMLFLFTVNSDILAIGKQGEYNVLARDDYNVERIELAEIFEAVFINYFKPKYNKEYCDTDIKTSNLIKKMKNNGINEIKFEINLNDDFIYFGSANTPFQRTHVIEYKL